MKFGPAVRFREPIVSGSESVAGRLWTTDKSLAADDDGAGEDEKKTNSYYDATTTSRKKILHLYIFYCGKKKQKPQVECRRAYYTETPRQRTGGES